MTSSPSDLELASLTIRLLANEEGGMSVDVSAEGEPSIVLAFGMLEMAKTWVWNVLEGDDDDDDY